MDFSQDQTSSSARISCVVVHPTDHADHQHIVRQTVDYTPSVWDDYFIRFCPSPSNFEPNVERMEELKKEVKVMLENNGNLADLETLSLIDEIQRLGLSYHFEREIDESLRRTLNINVVKESDDVDRDLCVVALRFRLLRQQGCIVPSDVFLKFKDEEGKFKKELTKNPKGLLHLYEASWLGTREEVILDEALDFSKGYLENFLLMKQTEGDNGVISAQVKHALKIPFYRGMRRLEARHHIMNYDQEGKASGHVLIELAKLDFNLLQSLHQAEIKDVSTWWKEIGLVKKLSFARDRLVEGYFWILGVHFEPQYSQARVLLTKILAFISLMDDMFDVHGTIEELQMFNAVMKRWDLHNVNHLPDYMRVYIDALVSLFMEIEENLTINGRLNRMQYLIEAYKNQAEAYLEEAKWASKGYMPTLEEYLNISIMSSAYPLLTISAFILTEGKETTNEVLGWVASVPKIVKYSAQIARIMNDLVSTELEQQRIHVATSLQCHINDHGATEHVAYKKLYEMNSDTWKDINKEWLLESSPSQRYLKMLALNYTRMSEVIYRNEDAYTNPSGEMKENIAALLVHPIQD